MSVGPFNVHPAPPITVNVNLGDLVKVLMDMNTMLHHLEKLTMAIDPRIQQAIDNQNAKADEVTQAIADELGELQALVQAIKDGQGNADEVANAVDAVTARLEGLKTSVQAFSDQLSQS